MIWDLIPMLAMAAALLAGFVREALQISHRTLWHKPSTARPLQPRISATITRPLS
jgi:hypothetical protein